MFPRVFNEEEKQNRQWAFRSVVSIRDIKKNEIITQDMVWTKRPGTGIPSKEIDKVIGKRAKKAISKNSLISWEQLES